MPGGVSSGTKSFAVVVRASGDKPMPADKVKKRIMTDVRTTAPALKVNAFRRVRNRVIRGNKGLESLKSLKKIQRRWSARGRTEKDRVKN